jgi:hypothetical protein
MHLQGGLDGSGTMRYAANAIGGYSGVTSSQEMPGNHRPSMGNSSAQFVNLNNLLDNSTPRSFKNAQPADTQQIPMNQLAQTQGNVKNYDGNLYRSEHRYSLGNESSGFASNGNGMGSTLHGGVADRQLYATPMETNYSNSNYSTNLYKSNSFASNSQYPTASSRSFPEGQAGQVRRPPYFEQ